jgi:nitroimidazol reductase NimA-like FMN-containing flavoprotein (pyridoxamine 5'-phosphate oxidase superfamily)
MQAQQHRGMFTTFFVGMETRKLFFVRFFSSLNSKVFEWLKRKAENSFEVDKRDLMSV